MLTDDYYWYWLCNIAGIGQKKTKKLLDFFGDAKSIYKAQKSSLIQSGLSERDLTSLIQSKKETIMYNEFLRLEKKGIKFVHINHKDYPNKLKQIYDYPVGFYYMGRLPDSEKMSVAVVGARNCTRYGEAVAFKLAAAMADMGIEIISGLAAGIDTAGHKGAISASGYTCAVLGSGIDVCYPKDNYDLYERIALQGCVISEYPPGTAPLAGQFPMRNRIISGLSDAVIVVEAKKKSGSLITADLALEQNKDVYAVPGRIGDVLSEGCNELIKQGAFVMTEAGDILQSVKEGCIISNGKQMPTLIGAAKKEKEGYIISNSNNKVNIRNEGNKTAFDNDYIEKSKINLLATPKNIVYSGLDLYPKGINTIIEETGFDMAQVSEALLYLQLEDKVVEVSKNCYIRKHI